MVGLKWWGESGLPKGESDAGRPRVVVDYSRCYSCGACVAVCPPDSIFLDNLLLMIDTASCTRCERCTAMCPVHALSMSEDAPEL